MNGVAENGLKHFYHVKNDSFPVFDGAIVFRTLDLVWAPTFRFAELRKKIFVLTFK